MAPEIALINSSFAPVDPSPFFNRPRIFACRLGCALRVRHQPSNDEFVVRRDLPWRQTIEPSTAFEFTLATRRLDELELSCINVGQTRGGAVLATHISTQEQIAIVRDTVIRSGLRFYGSGRFQIIFRKSPRKVVQVSIGKDAQ